MDNAPCKDCPDRVVEPNCHMTCEKYIAFQKMCRERIKAREYEREYEQYRYAERAGRPVKPQNEELPPLPEPDGLKKPPRMQRTSEGGQERNITIILPERKEMSSGNP